MASSKPLQPYAEIHQKATAPGDGRPTAQQIIDDEGLVGKWSDKTMLITGASSGIGKCPGLARLTCRSRKVVDLMAID